MDLSPENNRDLIILEQIEKNPEATQANLASQIGVAVGTINWHLKRMVAKGYVKVRRAERRKLLYIITPEGLALRARLTLDYIDNSFNLYRLVRQRAMDQINEVKKAGHNQVRLSGSGDVVDVVRLSCLEQGIQIVEDSGAPLLRVKDLKVYLEWGISTQPSNKPEQLNLAE